MRSLREILLSEGGSAGSGDWVRLEEAEWYECGWSS